VSELMLNNCWASSAGTGLGGAATENGVLVSPGSGTINGVSIENSMLTHNKGAGASVVGGSNISISSSQVFCNSQVGSAQRSGVEIGAGVSGCIVTDNPIGDGGYFAGSNLQAYGVDIALGASGFVVRGNGVQGNVTGGIRDLSAVGVPRSVSGNVGYSNAYRGEAVIASGSSSVAIPHGLSVTPAPSDILLSPLGGLAAVGITSFWVSATSATTVTVTASGPVSGNFYFTWDAKSAGA
jgi:hypothetical protein